MADTKFKEGHPKLPNSGRKMGGKNKLTIDVQQTAFEIFEKLGGIEGACKYFESSKQTKGQFYNIFYKMLPSNIAVGGSKDNPLPIRLIIENANTNANNREGEGS